MNSLKLPRFLRAFFLFIMLTLPFSMFAQTKVQLQLKKAFIADDIRCDKFGMLYAIKGYTILQYDTSFRQLKSFSSKSFSLISSIDVSDPFKILVFVRDFSNLQMLDNTLSPTTSEINMTSLGLLQVELLCTASENSFWVFDAASFQLYRYNFHLKKLNSSGDLRLFISSNSLPLKMMEFDNKLYVLFPEEGIAVFDVFGTYIKTLPFLNVTDFQFFAGSLFMLIKNKLLSYHLFTLEQGEFSLQESIAKKFCIHKQSIYVLSSDSLSTYSIK